MKRKKICIVTTVSLTMNQFIIWSLDAFHKNGFDVTLVCDMDQHFIESLPKHVNYKPVKMARGIDPFGALKAIFTMNKFFKKEKFDLIQYSTPNASMYASVASRMAGTPVRLYCQWGIIYVGMSGLKRRIFKSIEKMVCTLSTDIQPDSHGNLYFSREEGLYPDSKSRVVWNGSARGVNLRKFDITKKNQYRNEIRTSHQIPQDTVVIGFLGRVGKEKGFDELIIAFRKISSLYRNVILLFVGPNEKPKTVDQEILRWFEQSEDVIKIGWTDETEKYYAAMDIMVFPSYREGFGNVVIEAEAMGVPVITTDIPGPQNGLVDGVTGYLVPKQTVDPIVENIKKLINDEELRIQMGLNGRKFVEENFDDNILLKKIIENREWLTHEKSLETKKAKVPVG